MRIEKKDSKNIVTFKDVPKGSAFKDEDGTVYMKLDYSYKVGLAAQYDSVLIENGSLVSFGDRNEEVVEILENAVLMY